MNMHDISKKFADGATKGKASNIFIEGDCIYSYGKHFIMAKRDGDVFLVCQDYYSSSTSKQQSAVRGALREKKTVSYTGNGSSVRPSYKEVIQSIEELFESKYTNFLKGNDVASATKLIADTANISSDFIGNSFDETAVAYIESKTNRRLVNLLASSKEFPYLRELALASKGKGFPKRGVIRKALFANQELPKVARRNKKYRFIESIKKVGAVAAAISSANLDGGYLAGVVCRDVNALRLVDSFYNGK